MNRFEVSLMFVLFLGYFIGLSASSSALSDFSDSSAAPQLSTSASDSCGMPDLIYQVAFTPRQNINEIIDLSCEILAGIARRKDKLPRQVIFELRECFHALSSALSEDETLVQLRSMLVSFVIVPFITAPWDHKAISDTSIKSDNAVRSTLSFAADAVKSISDGSILISDTIKLDEQLTKKVTDTRNSFVKWVKGIVHSPGAPGGEVSPPISPRGGIEASSVARSIDYSMQVEPDLEMSSYDFKNGSGSSSAIESQSFSSAPRSGRIKIDDSEMLSDNADVLSRLSLTGGSTDSFLETPRSIPVYTISRASDAYSDSEESLVDSSMAVGYDSDDFHGQLLSSSSGTHRHRSRVPRVNSNLDSVPETTEKTFLSPESASVPGKKARFRAVKQPSSQDLSEFPTRASSKPSVVPVPKKSSRSKPKSLKVDDRGSASSIADTTSSIDRKTMLLSTASGSSADFGDIIIARRVPQTAVKRQIVRSKSEERISAHASMETGFEDSSDEQPALPKRAIPLSPRTFLKTDGSLTMITPRAGSSQQLFAPEFKTEQLPAGALHADLWMSPNQKLTLADVVSKERYTVVLVLRSFGCVMCRRMVSHFANWHKVMQAIHAQYVTSHPSPRILLLMELLFAELFVLEMAISRRRLSSGRSQASRGRYWSIPNRQAL